MLSPIISNHPSLQETFSKISNSQGVPTATHPEQIDINTNSVNSIVNKATTIIQNGFNNPIENHTLNQFRPANYLIGIERIVNGMKPRIECRKSPSGGIVQIAVLFKSSDERDKALKLFSGIKQFKVNPAGRTTIEITHHGIDKGLAIKYINNHFNEILRCMGFHANPSKPIQPYLNRTIVMVDADDTLYKKSDPKNHYANNLRNSAAYQSVLDYLEAGGLLAISTGNDSECTRRRLLEGIPTDKRHYLSQILIIGNGGSVLTTFSPDAELVNYQPYRNNALKENLHQTDINLDVVYLGDNISLTGNDYPAFQTVGFSRAISVSPLPANLIPLELLPNHIGQTHQGTANFLNCVTNYALHNQGESIFSKINISNFVSKSKNSKSVEIYNQKHEQYLRHQIINNNSLNKMRFA